MGPYQRTLRFRGPFSRSCFRRLLGTVKTSDTTSRTWGVRTVRTYGPETLRRGSRYLTLLSESIFQPMGLRKLKPPSWRVIPISKWLGSPPFISNKWPFGRGKKTLLRGLTITIGFLNRLVAGMILQARAACYRGGQSSPLIIKYHFVQD